MGSLKSSFRIFIAFLILLGIVVLSYLVVKRWYSIDLITNKGNIELLEHVEGDVLYSIINDSSIKCDLTTLTRLVDKMQQDGYEIVMQKGDSKSLEIILRNDEMVHHMKYVSNGVLTNISSPYEKSYIPFSYIYEE